jgi:flagellar hook-associated protein 2
VLAPTYAGASTYASGTTLLSSLTDSTGATPQLAVGSTIVLHATQGAGGGSAGTVATPPPTFTVTATSTLDDLRAFVQTSLAGSSVTIDPGGELHVTSAGGIDQGWSRVSLGSYPDPAHPEAETPLLGASTDTAGSGYSTVQSAGTLKLSAGGLDVDVAVNQGESMTDVAAAINQKNSLINATVVNGMLRLVSQRSGVAGAITLRSGSADLGLTDLVPAQDAQYSIDNGPVQTSSSNTITGALTGVTLSLSAPTLAGQPVTLNVNPNNVDTQGIATKVQSFVSAYNDVVGFISDAVNEQPVQNPTTDDDRIKGALFGDSTMESVLDSLREAMQDPVSGTTLGTGQNLGSFAGLSTGAIGTTYSADVAAGKLQLDTTALTSALAGGTNILKQLFTSNGSTSGGQGLMQRISNLSFGMVQVGGTVAAEIDGETAESADLTQRIADMQLLLDQRQQTLKDQFTAMETALGQLKSMGSQFASSVAGSSSSSSG